MADGEWRNHTTERVEVLNFREILIRLCNELNEKAFNLDQYGDEMVPKVECNVVREKEVGTTQIISYEAQPENMIDPDEQPWHHTVRVAEVYPTGESVEHAYDWIRRPKSASEGSGAIEFFKHFPPGSDRSAYLGSWMLHDIEEEYGDETLDSSHLQRLIDAMNEVKIELSQQEAEKRHEAVVRRARTMLVAASAIEALEMHLEASLDRDELAREGLHYLASLPPEQLMELRQESVNDQLNAKVTAVTNTKIFERLKKARNHRG